MNKLSDKVIQEASAVCHTSHIFRILKYIEHTLKLRTTVPAVSSPVH